MTDQIAAYRQRKAEARDEAANPDPFDATATDPVTAYRARKARGRSAATERSALRTSLPGVNPDAYAAMRETAQQYRDEVDPNPAVTPELVEAAPDRFRQRLQHTRNSTALATSPVLRDWLNDEVNAKLAADDVSVLAGFGRAVVNAAKRGGIRAGAGARQAKADAIYDAGQRFNADGTPASFVSLYRARRSDRLGGGLLAPGADLFGAAYDAAESAAFAARGGNTRAALQTAFTNAQVKAARLAAKAGDAPMSETAQRAMSVFDAETPMSAGEAAGAALRQLATDPASMIALVLEVGAESAVTLVPAVAASAVTRNPAVGIGIAGGSSYAMERYAEPVQFFADKGYDLTDPEQARAAFANAELMEEATRRGHTRGLIIGALDTVSGGLAGRALSRNPVADAALQSGLQMVLGGGGEALAQQATDGEVDYGDVVIEALAEFATTPIEVIGVARRKFGERRTRAQHAQDVEETLQDIADKAGDSKLRGRAPAVFRDFVEQAAEQSGAENLFVPVDEFTTLFQSADVTAEQIADALPGVSLEQIKRAQVTGEDVIVPLSTFADVVAGSDIEAFMVENSRIDPEAMTAAEARAFEASSEAEQREVAETVLAETERRSEDEIVLDRIYDQVSDRITQAGQPREAATRQASLFRAFYATQAKRSGLSVAEFADRYARPQVRGPQVAPARPARNVEQVDRDIAALRARTDARTRGGNFDAGTRTDTPENAYVDSVEQAVVDAGLDPATATDDEIRAAITADGNVLEQNDGDDAGTENQAGSGRERAGQRRSTDASGSPKALEGARRIKGAAGPDPQIATAADAYADKAGIDHRRQLEFVEVDIDFAERVGAAYEAMEHNPDDPAVKASYEALKAETLAQYETLVEQGYTFWFFDLDTDPYEGKPWRAMKDLRATKSMAVFTSLGEGVFGSGDTDIDVSDNPLLEIVDGLTWPFGSADGEPASVTHNDVFRAVHDAFGHGMEGAGFRARGEENAWQAHAALYSDAAIPAMTSETRGQNSWLNFGPHGEHNRTAPVEETIFADQKTGIMLPFTWQEQIAPREDAPEPSYDPADPMASPEFRDWFGDSKVVDADGKPLVVYHGTAETFDTFDSFRPEAVGFFTPDRAFADEWALQAYEDFPLDEEGGAARVYHVYLRVENPFDFRDPAHVKRVVDAQPWNGTGESFLKQKAMELATGHYEEYSAGVARAIRDAGFDGYYEVEASKSDVINIAVFDPAQIKSVDNVGSFNPDDPRIYYQTPQGTTQRDENGFYSKLVETVRTVRLPGWTPSKKNPDGAARADQVAAKLKSEGIKAEEFEWTAKFAGETFLETLERMGDTPVTRPQVEQMAREGGLRMEVIENGSDGDMYAGGVEVTPFNAETSAPLDHDEVEGYSYEVSGLDDAESYDEEPVYTVDFTDPEGYLDGAEAYYNSYDDTYFIVRDGAVYDYAIDGAGELGVRLTAMGREYAEIYYEGDMDGTRWGDYVTPGDHSNYREVLLTLPDTDGEFTNSTHFDTPNVVTFLRTTDRDVGTGRMTPEKTTPDAFYDDWRVEKNGGALVLTAEGRTLAMVGSSRSAEEAAADPSLAFGAGYVVEGGRLKVSGRTTMGRVITAPALFLDEMQSDWHQGARQGYYDTDEGRAALNAELAKVRDEYNAETEIINAAYSAQEKATIAREVHEGSADNTPAGLVRAALAVTYQWPDGDGTIPSPTDDAIQAVTAAAGAGVEPSYSAMLTLRGVLESAAIRTDKIYNVAPWAAEYISLRREEAVKRSEYRDVKFERRDNPAVKRYLYLQNAEAFPDAPFKGDAWITLGMRKAAMMAVAEGKQVFAWADAQTLADRWSDKYMKAYTNQYDRKMPGIAKKIFGAAATHLNLDGTPYTEGQRGMWVVDLTQGKPQEKAADIAQQGLPLFQRPPDQTPKGQIALPSGGPRNGEAVIDLFKTADLSTFLHESSHFFLSVMQDAAKTDPETRVVLEQARKWWADNAEAVAKEASLTTDEALEYLAVGTLGDRDKDARMDVATQEQWARAFETYLLEGKAPSQELRGAFEQFRAWLLAVYARVRGDLNVRVTDDIRQVFDMMLATDEQIEAARVTMDDGMIAASAQEMGVSPQDYEKLVSLHKAGQDAAAADTIREAMAPIRAVRRTKYRARLKEIGAEVAAEVNARPVFRALEWLGNKRWLGADVPDALPGGMRLSKEQLVERYGPGVLRTLPRGSYRVYTPGGMDADEVAGWFGFSSGDALVKALENAPKRDAEIARIAEERALAELENDDGTASAAEVAVEAFHSNDRANYIAAELRALNKQVGGAQDGSKRRHSTASYARQVAKRTLAGMRARDAVASNRYLAAERRAGQAAQTAFAEGDTAKAADEKRKQLIGHMMYVESKKIADEVGKAERLAKRLQSKGTRKNLAPDYLGAIDDLLGQYDFRKIGPGEERSRARLLAYLEMMREAGRENELAIPQGVLDNASRAPYMTLPVEQLRGVSMALKNIEHTARMKKKLLDAKREREMDAVVGDIEDAFAANIKAKPPARVDNKAESRRRSVKEYLNYVLNPDTLLREIDGWSIGAVYDHIKRGVDDASALLQVRRQDAAETLETLYGVYTRKERNRMSVAEQHDVLGGSYSKWDMIAMVLNMGNADNIQRLTDDRVKGAFTQDQLDHVVGQMDKRDLDFVQSVWDYLDSYYGEIAERERRVTGVAPEKVAAQELVTQHGTYRGGYYPIKYDPRLDAKVSEERTDEIMQNMRAGRQAKAQTRNGHTKERAKSSGRPVLLDIGVLHGHVNTVLHDLAFSEETANVWRILQDPRVKGLFYDYGRQADHTTLELWVQDVASGQINAAEVAQTFARKLKSGFTVSKLAFNLSTVLLQVTGIPQSMVVIGKRNFTHGLLAYAKNPVGAARQITEVSSLMAERETTFNKDIYDMMGDLKVGPTAGMWQQVKTNVIAPMSFLLMQKVQFYAVDAPTWMGAHRAALKRGDTETDAIHYADRMVARAQASGIFADRAAVERGTLSNNTRQNDFVRLFTALGSYMFAKANIAYERTGNTDFKNPAAVLAYTADMALLFTLEAVLFAAIKGNLPGGGDDDEDSWTGFLAEETGLAVIGTLPFIRDVGGALRGYGGGGAYGSIGETFGRGATAGWVVDENGELDVSAVKAYSNLAGMLFGLPSTQFNRMMDAELKRQDGEDVSPLEYMIGVDR